MDTEKEGDTPSSISNSSLDLGSLSFSSSPKQKITFAETPQSTTIPVEQKEHKGIRAIVYSVLIIAITILVIINSFISFIQSEETTGNENSNSILAPLFLSIQTELSTKGYTSANYSKYIREYQKNLKQKSQLYQNNFNTIRKEIEITKNDISQAGYMDQTTISSLSETLNNGIQNYLISLETVKLLTAVKVFSQLPSFKREFLLTYPYTPAELDKIMILLSTKGEKNIINYYYSCRFNPYENDNCRKIDDFGILFDGDSNQRAIFEDIIAYIDQKLENTEYPSIGIAFENYDPQNQTIRINIQINTLEQDEDELMNQGVAAPHIYIVRTVVDLLKQSYTIIGDSIKIPTIQISKRKIIIGGTSVSMNHSELKLTLPLQKTIEREIYDINSIDE